MIELRTGLPRNGKTLSIVHWLSKLLESWEKNPQAGRPVFVHNIPDLLLPHSPMPCTEKVISRDGQTVTIPDWDAMPDGSLVIIDEAQDCFPPRSSQSMAPPHVAWLNRHGHRGFDIIVTTQHPKLIDGAVRALVGKHLHFRRTFGWEKSIVYEWDSCSDNLMGFKNAVTSYFQYPKQAFKYYKSASEHTKQKFKLPRWFAIPIIGIVGCLYFLPHAYSVVTGVVHGHDKTVAASASPVVSHSVPASGNGGAVAPTSAGVPSSLLAKSDPVPRFVGCIASASRCKCITDAGVVVDEPAQCRESAEHVGYLVALAESPSSARLGASGAAVESSAVRSAASSESVKAGSSPGLDKPVVSRSSTFGQNALWNSASD